MPSKDPLPLTEVAFFILLSLAIESKHGYAIMKEVGELSDGRVLLATGTLYSALHRMLQDGWIERVPQPPSGTDGRKRKFYRLTEAGRRILDAETARLRRLTKLSELREKNA